MGQLNFIPVWYVPSVLNGCRQWRVKMEDKKRVQKVGGSFQHTGTVVAEFVTTGGEPRIVVEFDAPVKGMLHIYRPDQVVEITGEL